MALHQKEVAGGDRERTYPNFANKSSQLVNCRRTGSYTSLCVSAVKIALTLRLVLKLQSLCSLNRRSPRPTLPVRKLRVQLGYRSLDALLPICFLGVSSQPLGLFN